MRRHTGGWICSSWTLNCRIPARSRPLARGEARVRLRLGAVVAPSFAASAGSIWCVWPSSMPLRRDCGTRSPCAAASIVSPRRSRVSRHRAATGWNRMPSRGSIFGKRETFAYACEAYARIVELGVTSAARLALVEELAAGRRPPDERVDGDEYVDALREAAA